LSEKKGSSKSIEEDATLKLENLEIEELTSKKRKI
jgi:hypothetical protein